MTHNNSGLEKFPYGLVLAKLGAIICLCSKKDMEIFPLQVWKQQLWVPALPADQPWLGVPCRVLCLPCRRSYGRRLEGIDVHGIFRRCFFWSEVSNCLQRWLSEGSWRNRPMSGDCHGTDAGQLLSVLSAVGARQCLQKSLQHPLAGSCAASEYLCSHWAWTDSSSYYFNAVQIVFVFQSGG